MQNMTPKEFLKLLLVQQLAASDQEAEEIWFSFEAFCQRELKKDYPESAFAALLLDGDDSKVLGLDVY